jgi:calcineurin-like phosphoesterase family protein
VEEMNEVMIERWNEVVAPQDHIYHLGDFAFFYGKGKKVEEIFSRLNGKMFLCIGSHDREIVKLSRNGFRHNGFITPFFKIKAVEESFLIKQGVPTRIFCSHYMHYVWKYSHYGTWHLYGHSHGGLTNRVNGHGKVLDVGVDSHDFRPWNVDEVIAEMIKLPDNFNLVKVRGRV